MKYKVLVADDELIIRRGIVKLILSFDLPLELVPQAKNGEEMLEIADTFKPDIILADINMPLLDGLKAIERICNDRPDTTVIIVSGYDNFSYARKAIDLGVLSYILKPFSNQEFREVLEKALDACRQRVRSTALNRPVDENSDPGDILEYIDRNYCNPEMSLSFLEQRFSVGRTTIGNYVRKRTGRTLINYVNHLRIEHGKALLQGDEEYSVSAVSDLLGYNNQHYFSRVFKQYCGVSPSRFRSEDN